MHAKLARIAALLEENHLILLQKQRWRLIVILIPFESAQLREGTDNLTLKLTVSCLMAYLNEICAEVDNNLWNVKLISGSINR